MKKLRAFTFVELAVVLAISIILTMVIFTDLRHYSIKTRRSDAKIALFDLASRLERYHTQNNTYVGATLSGLGLQSNQTPNGEYTISIQSQTSGTFLIIAAPQGAQATADTECATFQLNQYNQRSITGTGNVDECWLS